MQVKDNKVVFVDDQGNKTELNIYFTWKNENNNKTYVFFYDDLMPQELIAGIVEEDGSISDIEDDEEYDELDEVLKSYENQKENEETK